MKQLVSLLAVSLLFWMPVFAEEPDKGQKPADQEAKEEQTEHNVNTAVATAQNPLPPGLEKQGKLPPGLQKKGKTPHGWSQGKAWWKRGGQTPIGSHPIQKAGVLGGGHAGHSNSSHGHR